MAVADTFNPAAWLAEARALPGAYVQLRAGDLWWGITLDQPRSCENLHAFGQLVQVVRQEPLHRAALVDALRQEARS